MSSTPWLLIAIAVILIIFLILAIIIKRGRQTPPDYYAFFWLGLIWTICGLPSFFAREYSLNGLFIMGIIFLIIGLVNKNKWKQNHRAWSQLSEKEKKLKIIVMTVLGVLVLAGLVVLLFIEKSII